MPSAPRYIAVFACPSSIPRYIVDCRAVIEKMALDADFANPPVALDEVAGHIDTLEADDQAMGRREPTAREKRCASLTLLRGDMRLLKAFVQSFCDRRSLAEAERAIHRAGMSAVLQTAAPKEDVAVKRGDALGQVVLDARAVGRRVIYQWQVSTDGETWADLVESLNARCTAHGLTARTLYYFRLRTVWPPASVSAWSRVVSVVVL